MAERSRRSSRWLVLVLLVGFGLLGGCQDSDGAPTPVPSSLSASASTSSSSSPSRSTPESEQERDLRLAGEAVVRYWAVVDRLAADPESSINELKSVAADQAFAQRRVALDAYRTKGWRQTGAASVTAVRATRQEPTTFEVSACVDVSGIDFLDPHGTSQVNPDRPDAQRFSYTVEQHDDSFVVVRDTLKGTPC